MSENSDEPPVNKQEKTIHHFYKMNKSICLFYRLFQNSVYCLAMFYSIHSHYCLFKE